jgi:hypothetical protein
VRSTDIESVLPEGQSVSSAIIRVITFNPCGNAAAVRFKKNTDEHGYEEDDTELDVAQRAV